jgi:hypothetical protein
MSAEVIVAEEMEELCALGAVEDLPESINYDFWSRSTVSLCREKPWEHRRGVEGIDGMG